MTQEPHIIQRQVVDLTASSPALADSALDVCEALLERHVPSALETLFDELSPAGSLVVLDRLEVGIGDIDVASLEQDFAERLETALRNVLPQYLAEAPETVPGDAAAPGDTAPTGMRWPRVLHFLTTGALPWWSAVPTRSELEAELDALIAGPSRVLRRWLATARSDARIAWRVATQFGPERARALTAILAPEFANRVETLRQAVNATADRATAGTAPDAANLWQAAWRALAGADEGLDRDRAFKAFLSAPSTGFGIPKSEIETLWQHTDPKQDADFQQEFGPPKTGLAAAKQPRGDPIQDGDAGRIPAPAEVETMPRDETSAAGETSRNDATPVTDGASRTDDPEQLAVGSVPRRADPEGTGPSGVANIGNPPLSEHEPEGWAKRSVPPEPDGRAGPAVSPPTQPADTGDPSTGPAAHRLSPNPESDRPDTAATTQVMPEPAAGHRLAPPVEMSVEDAAFDGLAVENAGLVLLWPFFATLLETVGYRDDAGWKGEHMQGRAANLLQFLATGETVAPEHELLLNKVVCGLPLDEPVPLGIRLKTKERTECEELLTAAISHWPALRNTSPAGLRQGFLMRPGLLHDGEEGWLLRVETMAHDVLLDTLSWGYSRIELSWMPKPLEVQW